jgi:hypothetical protein
MKARTVKCLLQFRRQRHRKQIAFVRIRSLQFLALAALAWMPFHRQNTYAATATKPAFAFGGVGYYHRWSQNDQHEFTPEGQDDLEKWSEMITVNVYSNARDGDALAVKANAVLEDYKSHNGAED